MNSFRAEPFLWIHLAGLAIVPVSLLAVWLGLAAGDPALPAVLEVGFLAIAGILPIAWMQWQRPFDIFSLLVLAIRPDRLTEEQRKILRLLKTQKIRIAAIAVAIVMVWAIWQIYSLAPLAAIATPLSPRWHLLGLLWAAIAFFCANLFLQIPVSVLAVLLTSDARFAEIEPYDVEKIRGDFLVFGIRMQNFLAIAPSSTSASPTQSVNPANVGISEPEPTADNALIDETEVQNPDLTDENTQTIDSLEPKEAPQESNIQADNLPVSEPIPVSEPEAEKNSENLSPEASSDLENEEDTATDKSSSDH